MVETVAIGKLELGMPPRIAVPLTDAELVAHGREALRWADVIELRVDLFDQLEPSNVADIARQSRALAPTLMTVRHTAQGGGAALRDSERLAIIEASIDTIDAIDIELKSEIRDTVLDLARGITTIASHHDFATTPPSDELDEMVEESVASGATITKIAATANTNEDSNRLLDLLRRHRERPMIVIAMGPHGAASRVFFPLCGSLLTYGFLNASVAPGQLSIQDLRTELERYCPERRPSRENPNS